MLIFRHVLLSLVYHDNAFMKASSGYPQTHLIFKSFHLLLPWTNQGQLIVGARLQHINLPMSRQTLALVTLLLFFALGRSFETVCYSSVLANTIWPFGLNQTVRSRGSPVSPYLVFTLKQNISIITLHQLFNVYYVAASCQYNFENSLFHSPTAPTYKACRACKPGLSACRLSASGETSVLSSLFCGQGYFDSLWVSLGLKTSDL